MNHQSSTYDQELQDLKDTILKMGVLVQELIHRAVESLKNRDKDMAKEVIKQDEKVDQLELEVDEKCINLIARRQPKAGDLRFVTTGMRIATDLERIGDLAEDIAERTIEISNHKLLKPLIDIPKMTRLCEESVALVLDCFINRDSRMVRNIWDKEKKVDELRDAVHDELTEIMSKSPKDVERAMPLLLVSRHLERICDHATNIAEDVIYMVEGKVVKHGTPPVES